MGYAFISYSTKNQSAADAMRNLFKKHKIDTWMAPYDIPAGSEYAEVLYDALSECSCLVLMLTDVSQNSQWVRKEVNVAITNGKTIIPVKLEDVELNSMMKFYLNDQQIVPVHVIDDNSAEIRSVLKSVIGLTRKKDEVSLVTQTSIVKVKSPTKKIELTVWSPVNTDVYLNDKRHLVMKIDHNSGFGYKHNSINVSGEFNLIFVSKGFEKVVAFDAVDDSIEYHLNAILNKKEINASYDREEAIEQIKDEPTAYAFKQLESVGNVEDVQLLKNELERLSMLTSKTSSTNYITATCATALGKLAIRYGRLEDAQLILKVYEEYEAKSSYGYMLEPIVKRLQGKGFSTQHEEVASEIAEVADNVIVSKDNSTLITSDGRTPRYSESFVCTEQVVVNSDNHELFAKREDTSDDGKIEIEEILYDNSDISLLDETEAEPKEEQNKGCVKTSKIKGHLVSSYRRVVDVSKEDCKQPIEILMPDGNTKFFDLCGEFAVSNQKRYIVARQKNDVGEYLFFVFRNRNGKITLISEGQDQRKVYRWFRKEHGDEYIFTDNKDILKNDKKKHFAQDTALKYYASANDIPQILILPEKYEYISSNAFIKLNPNNKEIRQIVISDSVEVIDENAFAGLIVTEAIHIPNSVKKIGHNAFTIKEGAYVYCEKNSRAYAHFSLREDVTVIKDIPFKRTVEKKTDKILEELFQSKNITRIKPDTIPYNVDTTEISEIILPEGICVLDRNALYHVKIRNRIVIPFSVTRIDKYAFNLMPEAYVECKKNSYAYLYCRENGIKNSVDIYQSRGVCTYCGGRFIGFFRKRCSRCGEEKDY